MSHMTKMQAAERILAAVTTAGRQTTLEPVDIVGGLNSDTQGGQDVPTEEECDQLASVPVPEPVAAKFPATAELLQTN